MNRGAYHRDRDRPSKNSGYENKGPVLRNEDLAFLGGTKERLSDLAAELKPTILMFAKGGARKPARVSLLLNKAGKKTPSGDFWNPRLVYFLLSEIFRDSKKQRHSNPAVNTTTVAPERRQKQVKSPSKPLSDDQIARNRRNAEITTVSLSDDEMKRRLLALRKHFKG